MAAFLNDDWFALLTDAAASWPSRPGVTATVHCQVASCAVFATALEDKSDSHGRFSGRGVNPSTHPEDP